MLCSNRVIDEDKSKKKGPEEKQPKKQPKKEEESQKEEDKPRKEPDKKEGKKEVESKRKNVAKPGVTSTSDSEDEDDQEGGEKVDSFISPYFYGIFVYMQNSTLVLSGVLFFFFLCIFVWFACALGLMWVIFLSSF